MKVAYLLRSGVAQYTGKVSRRRYFFSPWAEVAVEDWEVMKTKVLHIRKCCGHPTRHVRVFGSDEEITSGVVGFSK